MLTIFTIPKEYKDHSNIIQRNALASWKKLGSDCEIFLCGDDPGTEEVASEYEVNWIPNVERNQFGTPILKSAFRSVAQKSKHDVLCYVNADIILLPDLLPTIPRINWHRTAVAGQRWDIDITSIMDFTAANYDENIRRLVAEKGKLHPPSGSDYFIFGRDKKLLEIPPFAVGRPGWDCWFIYYVRMLGYRMVDATGTITVVHQNHDYSHVNRQSGWTSDGKDWRGAEVEMHHDLIGHDTRYFNLSDATHYLRAEGVRAALDYDHLRSRWHRLPHLHPGLSPLTGALDQLAPNILRRALRKILERQ